MYELRLLLWWALANGLGGAIAGFLEARHFQFLATLVLTGPILGICQWLVLRRYLGKVRWWPIATTLGWLLAMPIRIGARDILNPIINYLYTVGGLWEVFWLNVVNTPVTLAVLALVQWLVLRPRGLNAGWWVLASAVGGILNGAIGATTCAKVCSMLAVGVGLGISQGLGWLAYGVVTGVVLICFSARHPAGDNREGKNRHYQ